jgi:hypothetical protein
MEVLSSWWKWDSRDPGCQRLFDLRILLVGRILEDSEYP